MVDPDAEPADTAPAIAPPSTDGANVIKAVSRVAPVKPFNAPAMTVSVANAASATLLTAAPAEPTPVGVTAVGVNSKLKFVVSILNAKLYRG